MKYLILAMIVLTLGGCATPYQREGFKGGYSQEDLGQNRFLVSFSGNGFTKRSTVQKYATRRAKELCAEHKMGFEILQIGGDTSQFQGASTSQCYGSYGTTNCTHSPGGTVSKHTTDVVVRCIPDTAVHEYAPIKSDETESESSS